MTQAPPPKWLTIAAREAKRLRVFVFPHAGSGAFPYRGLAGGLPGFAEIQIAQLPGRETTFGAQAFRAMQPLATALATQIAEQRDLPTVFVGHSFGAHLAAAVSRELRAMSAPLPKILVASSTRAPHQPTRRPPMHKLSKKDFIARLREYGGTPEAVLADEDFLELFLPPLYADLEILETYQAPQTEPFRFPIYAFGGTSDTTTHPEDLRAWEDVTTGPFTFRLFEGGHFYLFEQSKAAFSSALAEILLHAANG